MGLTQYSVTTVLKKYSDFSNVPRHILDRASKRGVAAHKATALHARGIPVMGLPFLIQGYFLSFKTWFDGYVIRVFFVETRFQDDAFGFNGTPDLVAELEDGRIMVIDHKTPQVEHPTWKMQLAGYLHLVRKEIEVDGAMSLILHPGGRTAKGIVYDEADRDIAAFLSALNAHRYVYG